jgi:RNA polymerase sigma-70 factor (ECF subfamily)
VQVALPAPDSVTRLDEQRTLARARNGDRDAFVALVTPHDRALRSLAFRLLGDEALMEDALQTAYVNAFRSLRSFRGGAGVATWLYRIAYNACLDELRRAGRRPVPSAEAAEELASPSSDHADVVARRLDVAAALAALSPEDRAAVLLVDGEGLGYRDVAAVLGVPEGTVGSRLNRARAQLRSALEPTAEEIS